MKDRAGDYTNECCNAQVDIESLAKSQYTTNRALRSFLTSNLAIHLRGSKSADSTN